MTIIRYSELRLGVLDDFYQEMINYGHQNDAEFGTIIGHLIYDYEQGFSNVENILTEFVIYVVAGKFISEKIRIGLQNSILEKLNSVDFKLLLQLLESEERSSFLHDLYLMNFIDTKTRDSLNQLS